MARLFAVALTTKKMVREGLAEEAGVEQYTDVVLPKRETSNAAGYDFRAAEDTIVPSLWMGMVRTILERVPNMLKDKGETRDELRLFKPYYIHTGVKVCMQDDEVLGLYLRSSTPKKFGLTMANSVGIIDSDYFGCEDNDGEIMFAVYNLFPFSVTIKKGERIGQGIFSKFLKADDDTANGERTGGYGSSDKQ
jgi:dUTP pyrophosphatase